MNPPAPSSSPPLALRIALVAAAAVLPYLRILDAPFVLDDLHCIVHNPAFRAVSAAPGVAGDACAPPTRAFGEATLALNHRLGGLEPLGYHLFNVAIHLAASLAVLWLVALVLRAPRLRDSEGRPHPAAPFVATLAALLFAAHPVQTQAITYVVQRFASLAALLYLAAAALYLEARLAAAPRRRWLAGAGALAATVLAMFTKETSFTLPFALALLELGLFEGALRPRLLALAPFAATLAIIPATLLGAGVSSGSAQVDASLRGLASNAAMTRWEYALTQAPVTVEYLRLLVWPAGQSLDHDVPLRRSLADPAVIGALALLLALAAAGALALFRWGRRRAPAAPLVALAGLGVLWFLLALSVEALAVPLPDLLVEHRLYLPAAGFLASAAALLALARERLAASRPALARAVFPAAGVAVLALGAAAVARNEVWRDPVTLWEDVTAKAPGRERAHLELGRLLLERGALEASAQALRTAARLDPTDAAPHNTLGAVLKRAGRPEEALASYLEALRLKPGWAEVHHNIGLLLASQGRLPEATAAFQEALRLHPSPDTHNALGIAYAQQGLMDAAIAEFRAALALDPAHPGAQRNLARAGGVP